MCGGAAAATVVQRRRRRERAAAVAAFAPLPAVAPAAEKTRASVRRGCAANVNASAAHQPLLGRCCDS